MIAGKTYRVENLKAKEHRALIGARVVAHYARDPDSDFGKLALGTVVAQNDDEFKVWVNFDEHGIMGLFDDEDIVVLDLQRATHLTKLAHNLIKHADNNEETFEDHVTNLEMMLLELTRFIPQQKLKDIAASLRRRVNKLRRLRNE